MKTTLWTDLTVGDICAGVSSDDKIVEDYMSLHRRDVTELAEAVEELLTVRLFDKTIKRKGYVRQTHNRAKGNA